MAMFTKKDKKMFHCCCFSIIKQWTLFFMFCFGIFIVIQKSSMFNVSLSHRFESTEVIHVSFIYVRWSKMEFPLTLIKFYNKVDFFECMYLCFLFCFVSQIMLPIETEDILPELQDTMQGSDRSVYIVSLFDFI